MNDQDRRPLTRGVHHLGLTVDNLDAARNFFVDVLQFDIAGTRPDYPAAFVTDGRTMLSLWQADSTPQAVPFDRRRNIGLHHVAFEVPGVSALHAMHATLLTADGVDFEFEPQALGNAGSEHMICRVPGGVRVEFIAPSQPSRERTAT